MKFRFDFWKGIYYILPTIVIKVNEPMYCCENFAIELHWIMWHCRWQWLKEQTI